MDLSPSAKFRFDIGDELVWWDDDKWCYQRGKIHEHYHDENDKVVYVVGAELIHEDQVS